MHSQAQITRTNSWKWTANSAV